MQYLQKMTLGLYMDKVLAYSGLKQGFYTPVLLLLLVQEGQWHCSSA